MCCLDRRIANPLVQFRAEVCAAHCSQPATTLVVASQRACWRGGDARRLARRPPSALHRARSPYARMPIMLAATFTPHWIATYSCTLRVSIGGAVRCVACSNPGWIAQFGYIGSNSRSSVSCAPLVGSGNFRATCLSGTTDASADFCKWDDARRVAARACHRVGFSTSARLDASPDCAAVGAISPARARPVAAEFEECRKQHGAARTIGGSVAQGVRMKSWSVRAAPPYRPYSEAP